MKTSALLFLDCTGLSVDFCEHRPIFPGLIQTRTLAAARPQVPVREHVQNRNPARRKTGSPAPSVANEVVELHSDTSARSPILVYEFDKWDTLIFQIHGDQMLKLVKDIRKRLEEIPAKRMPVREKQSRRKNGNQLKCGRIAEREWH